MCTECQLFVYMAYLSRATAAYHSNLFACYESQLNPDFKNGIFCLVKNVVYITTSEVMTSMHAILIMGHSVVEALGRIPLLKSHGRNHAFPGTFFSAGATTDTV